MTSTTATTALTMFSSPVGTRPPAAGESAMHRR
ncbi:hypothetical protein Ae406Ps2_0890c [Pseudonocardia sp. Ae406_Ps2]|nr:hypothetical protein Ae406Ps2_0890c [Pseudonocardia sp. Ae406_Ps2]OLM14507.1 hypothetical protein Ae505Ps2_4637 [Pseudonocardia sp. Ae505_Ps2]OLM22468.1 hypothetical protein Ae706Ps2_0900c [Pseudonocardia sp. Ae706_Ps2]